MMSATTSACRADNPANATTRRQVAASSTGGVSAGCGSGWIGSALRAARARRGMGGVPTKRERRTKDASGAPAKGHGERALADAPLRGAAFKALPLQLKLGGFPESSGLTLARRSFVAGATFWPRHGYSTRRTG